MAYTAQDRLALLDKYQVGTPAPQQKKGNLFTSLLPTIGGVAGGALGSIFAPGVGTAAGGAGGAMLGKKLSNMLTGEDDKLQDYLVEGAFGTIGGVGKAAKGIKGAGAALKGGQGARAAGKALRYGDSLQDTLKVAKGGAASLGDDVVRGADDIIKPIKTGKGTGGVSDINSLQETSMKLRGKELGIDTGTRYHGRTLGAKEAGRVRTFGEKSIGVGAGDNAEMAARKAVDYTESAGKQIEDLVKANNGTLTRTETNRIRQNAQEKLKKSIGGLATEDQKEVKTLLQQIGGNKDRSSLYDFRKEIDKRINFARNPATPNPAREEALKVVRNEVNEALGSSIPKYKDSLKNYSSGMKYRELVEPAAGKLGTTSKLGGAIPVPFVNQIAQKTQNVVGRGAGTVGDALAGTGSGGGIINKVIGDPNTFKRAAFDVGKTQVPARTLLGGMSGGEEPPVDDLQSQLGMASGEIYPNETPGLPNGISGALDPMTGMPISQEPTSQYPIENFLSDVQRDPQNMKEYQQLFAMINPNYGKEPKKTQAFGRPSAQLYSQAKTGMASVDKLMNMIDGNAGLVNAAAVPGQSLPIVGGLISKAAGTNEYKAAASNILNSIARINTGAAMPPSEEAFYARTYLPQPGDDPATMQAKVQNLYQFFNPIANYETESSGGGGGDQIMDALALGGYQ